MAAIISISTISYLTSLSHPGPVNPSTPTFPNINLTETITNLISVWELNQNQQQEYLSEP